DAFGAADAHVFVDHGDARRCFDAAFGIERQRRTAGDPRQHAHAFLAARRTTIDRRLAARDRFGIRPASGITTAGALGLRQDAIDAVDLRIERPISWRNLHVHPVIVVVAFVQAPYK